MLQLQLGFSTWPGNFHILWVQPLKKKKEERKKLTEHFKPAIMEKMKIIKKKEKEKFS